MSGCGCRERADEISRRTGISSWKIHASLGIAAFLAAIVALERFGKPAAIVLVLAGIYAFKLAKDAHDGI